MSARKPKFEVPHPGDLLRETLEELGVSRRRFAAASGIDPSVVSGICNRRRGVSAETAIRIARTLGTDAQSWLNLQAAFDLDKAERARGAEFSRISVLPELAPAA